MIILFIMCRHPRVMVACVVSYCIWTPMMFLHPPHLLLFSSLYLQIGRGRTFIIPASVSSLFDFLLFYFFSLTFFFSLWTGIQYLLHSSCFCIIPFHHPFDFFSSILVLVHVVHYVVFHCLFWVHFIAIYHLFSSPAVIYICSVSGYLIQISSLVNIQSGCDRVPTTKNVYLQPLAEYSSDAALDRPS